jgi:hypothetical protein
MTDSEAVWLIRYRRDEVVTINGDAAWRIINECTEAELAALWHEVLDLFSVAANQFHTPLGLMAIDAALSEMARGGGEQSTDKRLAAEIILARRQVGVDTYDDNTLRDIGADTFDRCIDQIDYADRFRETVMATVDVLLELLPELYTDEGMMLLNGIDTERTPS